MVKRYSILLGFLVVIFSCKRTTELSGTVTNMRTGAAIEGASIYLYDESTGGIFENGEIEVEKTVLSDATGYFYLELKTSLDANVRYNAGKEGYKNPKTENAVSGVGLKTGQKKEVKIELEGIAYFGSPFEKKSTVPKGSDQFKLTVLPYSDISGSLNDFGTKEGEGKGPFYYTYEDSYVIAKGDRFLRYKLEWKTDNVWYSKIDSVYLPTSTEVYRDTIFY